MKDRPQACISHHSASQIRMLSMILTTGCRGTSRTLPMIYAFLSRILGDSFGSEGSRRHVDVPLVGRIYILEQEGR